MPDVLPASFYNRPVLEVARGLLGMRLVRLLDGSRISGTIIEAEAYDGEQDLACHACHGRTARTQVMYGEAGRAYVYFTYGMHWMLNCVACEEGYPAAVLIRAIHPLEGIDCIAARREGRPRKQWTDGPAKLCQALDIDRRFNGCNLCSRDSALFIEKGHSITDENIIRTPRIGIGNVPEPWLSQLWRFTIRSSDPGLL